MRVVLEVEDEKAAFFLEILSHFDFVELDDAAAEKARILESIRSGMEEVKSAERGEIKLQTARELLDEL